MVVPDRFGERAPKGAPRSSAQVAIAAVGVGAVGVLCCVGLPVIAAALGGLALAAVIGVGGGVLLALAVGALLIVRARRRRGCAGARQEVPRVS